MVDEKKPEGDKKDAILDVNVALVLAENMALKEQIASEKDMNADLSKRLTQAMDVLENQTKSMLIADIKPRVNTPIEYLGAMTVEKLSEMQKVLHASIAPVFKSGTPMGDMKKKPTLDGMFEEFAVKTWRKN